MNNFLLILIMSIGGESHEFILDSNLSLFECETVAVVDNFLYSPELKYECVKGE